MPKVPAVIQVEDDAVSVISTLGTRQATEKAANGKELAILNGQRKRVLPDSKYKKALGSIIRRDYFPNAFQSNSSVRSCDTTTTLTRFHAQAASNRQVEFQLALDHDAAEQRKYMETTKYSKTSSEQNPVFFPVVPRGKPANRMEALPMSTSASATSNNSHRTIVPDATRFPQPKPKVPQHWETDTVDGSSNGFTDLDSTIVLSLRSEIRRGKLRKHARSSVSSSTRRRRVRPPLDSDESIGYALRKAYKRPRKSSTAG